MKLLFVTLLLSTSFVCSMQKLSSSSDLAQLSLQELAELKEQRRATPVPSLNCVYVDKEEGEEKYRFIIAETTGFVLNRIPVYKRPHTW